MKDKSISNNIDFLNGGGEMGKLIRDKNWGATVMGTTDLWPQSLRTSLSIILNSKFPMFLFWGEDHICFYNDAYRPSLGNSGKHPSILGTKGKDAWLEIWEVLKPMIEQILAGGEASFVENHLLPIYRNGKLEDVYWTYSYSPVNDETGKPGGIFVACYESTENILLINKIKESEERFRLMAENSDTLIATSNESINVTYFNNAWSKLTGRAVDELIDVGWADIVHEDDKEGLIKTYLNAIEKKESFSCSFRILNKEGTYSWLLSKAAPRYEDGTFSGYISSSVDVTELNNALEKIKVNEMRFRTAVEAVKGFLWTNNPIGEMTGEQPGWTLLTGQVYEDYQGYGWTSAIHPDDVQPTVKAWNEAVRTLQIFIFKHRVKLKDGTWRLFSVKAVPLLDGAGKLQEWVGVHTDIQVQKDFETQLETQVSMRTQELFTKNIELNQMNKELESFTYVSSHDLQEPLRKIQTFASRIHETEYKNLSNEGKHMLERMENAAFRMKTLLSDLLTYSRTGHGEKNYELIDLQEILADVKEELKEEIDLKQAVIQATQLCKIPVIRFQFNQLLQNLISNALKFSREGVCPIIKIWAVLGTDKDFNNKNLLPQKLYCFITISDNGIGFKNDYNKKIFELFQRLDGRGLYSGTGIGLAIVKKIVENHKGFITAEGKPNEGATFKIYLPIT